MAEISKKAAKAFVWPLLRNLTKDAMAFFDFKGHETKCQQWPKRYLQTKFEPNRARNDWDTSKRLPRPLFGLWRQRPQNKLSTMANMLSVGKIWAKSGKKWLRYHQWPMQPLFGLWFWRPWNKTSLPFSLFSPYSIPTVCKNGQDCAEHFYMMAHHSTQPRLILKKVFRG